MRKEDISSLIIYFIMIAVAIIVGLTVISDAVNQYGSSAGMSPFLFVILVIVVGLLFNVIMLEALHALGAKLGGYKVTSFNVLGFCFFKKEGKTSFKFKEFDGLTGETKIAPKKEKLNLRHFIWLPLFGYAAEIATCIVVYRYVINNTSETNGWLAVASLLFIIISSMIALYNLVPLKLDSMTDGYRFVLFAKPVNLEAYNELLRIEDLEREGKDVAEIKVFEEITEFTANLNLISVYHHLDKAEYEEAEKLVDIILTNPKAINLSTQNRLIAQKLYIEIMTKTVEEVKESYDKIAPTEIRRFIANDNSLESIRAYTLIAGVIEGSLGEVKYAQGKITKATKNALPSRVAIEKKLNEQALKKVYSIHPKWETESEK